MITLEAFLDEPCPRVGVTVSGMDPSGAVVTVWRSVPGERARRVRTARDVRVYGSDYFVDYDAPLGREVTYWVEVVTGTPDSTTATVTLNAPTGWLQDPLVPQSAVSVGVQRGQGQATLRSTAFEVLERSLGTQLVPVLGSNEPVALSGQRLVESDVDFSLLTYAAEQNTALREVLRDAFPVLVRPLPGWGDLPSVMYLSAEDVTEERLRGKNTGVTRWRLSGDLVAAPTFNVLVPLWTYGDVEALWATYQQALDAALNVAATYLDELRDPTFAG